jgi:hypothetical protein
MVRGSSILNDEKKKNSQVNPRKTTGNMASINTELVLFFHIWLCKPK